MTAYSRTLLVVASLFCLIFSAVRSDAQDADLTLDESYLATQEVLKPMMLAADTWKELMKPRTWRSASGNHEIKAHFVRFDPLNNKVILKTAEDKELPIAISKLSRNHHRILGDIAEKQQDFSNLLPLLVIDCKDIAETFFELAKYEKVL